MPRGTKRIGEALRLRGENSIFHHQNLIKFNKTFLSARIYQATTNVVFERQKFERKMGPSTLCFYSVQEDDKRIT